MVCVCVKGRGRGACALRLLAAWRTPPNYSSPIPARTARGVGRAPVPALEAASLPLLTTPGGGLSLPGAASARAPLRMQAVALAVFRVRGMGPPRG